MRRKLDASTDATLLSRVGARLTRRGNYSKEKAIQEAREQAKALGIRYLQRAIELDPNLETAKTSLYLATASEQQNEADRLANRAHERYISSEDITEYAQKAIRRKPRRSAPKPSNRPSRCWRWPRRTAVTPPTLLPS